MKRVVVEAGEKSLGSLEDLNELRGVLEIMFIDDYDDEADAKKAAIGSKKHITELALSFIAPWQPDVPHYVITDGVVAALQPHPDIQTLRIYGLLPSWIMSSLDHLTELELFGVENVSTLPPFWKLQFLKTLLLTKFSALEFIGRDFLGMDNNPNSTVSAFPELKVLKFTSCPKLRGWEDLRPEEDANHGINVMPKIEILELEECREFYELPRQLIRQASSLKKLLLRLAEVYFGIEFKDIADGVDGVLFFHQDFQKIRMTIKSSTMVPTTIIYPNYIKLLDLYGDEELISYLPPMGKLPYLESLTIDGFSSLKIIGRDFLGINNHNNEAEFVSFPELVKLDIHSCKLLEGWEDLKPEDEGKITVMPKLEAIGIRRCVKYKKLPIWLHLKLSSLKGLELHDGNFMLQSEELENGLLAASPMPPALESLNIQTYEATKLPNWFMYLNNLTRLVVDHAENVLSVPPLGKLPSLMFLTIDNFPSLLFIGREFLGIDNATIPNTVCFPKLVKMELTGCPKLEVWEDIKADEEDKITIMPNLKTLKIMYCYQFESFPSRLIRKASNLEKLKCDYNNDLFAESIKKDKELLERVKRVFVNRQQCY